MDSIERKVHHCVWWQLSNCRTNCNDYSIRFPHARHETLLPDDRCSWISAIRAGQIAEPATTQQYVQQKSTINHDTWCILSDKIRKLQKNFFPRESKPTQRPSPSNRWARRGSHLVPRDTDTAPSYWSIGRRSTHFPRAELVFGYQHQTSHSARYRGER
jgi:hypothetical protein